MCIKECGRFALRSEKRNKRGEGVFIWFHLVTSVLSVGGCCVDRVGKQGISLGRERD